MPDNREQAGRHLVPHFTRGDAWRADDLVIIDRGEGCYVWDADGNKYLDGLAGLFCTNLGHGRTDLTAAATKQMDKLAFYPNWGFAHPSAIEGGVDDRGGRARRPRPDACSSSAPAPRRWNRLASSPAATTWPTATSSGHKVIARHFAYHGTTLGALALTGIPNLRDPYAPMLAGEVRHVANTLGCRLKPGQATRDLPCVAAVEEAILAEGPETVAMVIAEPVQNGRGALVPPEGYWQELRRICDRHGVLLCADEVINAFGRLGHWFGSERVGAQPDMITFAKGVTSAYQPLAGLLVRGPLLEQLWDSPAGMFLHGSTFGGHPVATAVAVANMTAMRDEHVFAGVLGNEDRLGDGLRALMQAHACVGDVRGTGYFYALELTRDRYSGADFSGTESAELLRGGVLDRFVREARVLVRPDDRGGVMLSVSPPLVADTAVIDDLLSRLDQVLDRVDAWLRNG